MKYLALCIACASLFALGACESDPCVIQIGDACIKKHEVALKMERFVEESMITSHKVLESMKPLIVDNIVEESLILEYARRSHIFATEAEIQSAKHKLLADFPENSFQDVLTESCRSASDLEETLRTRATIDKVIDVKILSGILVNPSTVQGYYKNHIEEFKTDESVELYHIYTQDKFKAQTSLSMLEKGQPFKGVAKKYSEEDANENGFMGIFTKEDLPDDIENVVFNIPAGRYSNIVRGDGGYQIFYVMEKYSKKALSLDQAKDRVEGMLKEKVFEQRYREWINSLKTEYKVKVDWDEIENISIG